MAYNLTNMSSSTGLADFTVAVNQITGGLFGISIIIALFAILLLSFMRFGTKEALIASSFISGLTAIMFAVVGLIQGEYVTMILVIMAIITAIGYVNR